MAKQQITQSQIAPQVGYSYVVTDEGTTSSSYIGLATPQAVTITVGSSGKVMVALSSGIYNVAAVKRMSVAISGATSMSASDSYSIREDAASATGRAAGVFLITGLNPGSTTFTAQFSTSSGTGRFYERAMYVEAK